VLLQPHAARQFELMRGETEQVTGIGAPQPMSPGITIIPGSQHQPGVAGGPLRLAGLCSLHLWQHMQALQLLADGRRIASGRDGFGSPCVAIQASS